jgi:large subunit ribosomal protein L17
MAVIELITSQTVTNEADRARRVAASQTAKAPATEAPATEAPAAAEQTAPAEVEESSSTEDAPYGEGSHAPLTDGGQPEGFPVKGNDGSKLYHLPGTSHYDRTVAEVWFASADAAEAAGFALPPSQREDAESGEKADS